MKQVRKATIIIHIASGSVGGFSQPISIPSHALSTANIVQGMRSSNSPRLHRGLRAVDIGRFRSGACEHFQVERPLDISLGHARGGGDEVALLLGR
jgi:hypothetical protein